MHILDRILLTLYSLITAIALLGAAVVSARLVSEALLWTNLGFLYGRWETAAALVLLAFVGLRLFIVAFKRTSSADKCEAIVVAAPSGSIRITITAIRSLLEKALYAISGVKEVKIEVYADRLAKAAENTENVRLRLRLVVHPEANIPELSETVRRLATEKMIQVVGVASVEVEVYISDITHHGGKTKPRVV